MHLGDNFDRRFPRFPRPDSVDVMLYSQMLSTCVVLALLMPVAVIAVILSER